MDEQNGYYIKLTKTDREDRSLDPPVTTLTFLKGKPPLDLIRQRVKEILQHNPWLDGQYRKHPETRQFPSLWIPDTPNIEGHLETVRHPDLRPDTPIKKLQRKLKPNLVNGGHGGRAKAPHPLFKVTVISTSHDRFCIVLSICHTLADGYTFYCIYSMLAGTSPIRSLDARRVDISEKVDEIVGAKRVSWFKSITTIVPFIIRVILNRNKPIFRYINVDWVAKQKRRYKPTDEVPFISTNDVITSVFMDQFEMDCGLMAVDARGRIPEVTKELAGTYEVPVILLQEEGFTAPQIRKTLLHRPNADWVTPGRLRSAMMNIGIVTSWASWDVDMPLEGCKFDVHIPLFALPMPPSFAVIWKANKDNLAVLLNAKRKHLRRIDTHPCIGQPVL